MRREGIADLFPVVALAAQVGVERLLRGQAPQHRPRQIWTSQATPQTRGEPAAPACRHLT
jgi:hypothetical protein